jgi:hypothetical protein
MTDLPYSSYGEVLRVNLGNGYPIGPHFQLASLTTLLGTEVAWLYQPYLAVAIAFAVFPAARILRSVDLGPLVAAIGGFAAATAYLPFVYGLQGGAKELIMVVLVLLAAVFAAELASTARPVAPAMLIGLAAAAAFTTYSAGGLPWFLAMAAAALAVAVVRSEDRLRTLAASGGVLAAVFAIGAAASLGSAIDFFEPARRLLGSAAEGTRGNLDEGLPPWESFGIWLAGDFRFGPEQRLVTFALIALAAVLAVLGAVHAFRKRSLALLLAAGASLLVWVVLPAGIYIEAKLLVILSPPLVLLALTGAAALGRLTHRPQLGALAGAVLVAAVLVSDGMAYRDAYIAPKGRLDELRRVGERFAGGGPTMLAEFEEHGKHFLRDMGVIAPFDGYQLIAPELRAGGGAYATWADLDELTLQFVQKFPVIVRRRNPVASRPPASYERAYAGDQYEVWRRRDGAPEVLEHLPLGDDRDPTGPVDCAAVRELAGRAGSASLVVAERTAPVRLDPLAMERPPDWPALKEGGVGAMGAGELRGAVSLRPGRYRVWVRGTFGRGVDVHVDGRGIGRADEIQTPEQMALAGEIGSGGGPHTVALVRGAPGLSPGNGRSEGYESIFFEPVAEPRLHEVPADRASSLCGGRADWVELLAR